MIMMEFDEVASIIKKGDSVELRKIFETGRFTDINCRQVIQRCFGCYSLNYNGPTLLMMACETGYIDCVRVLLDYKADFNYDSKKDLSILAYACRSGSVDMVHFIINSSGLTICDEVIMNAFQSETIMRNTEISFILLEYIKDINFHGDDSFLCYASKAGNVAIVRSLLERGADPSTYGTALFVASSGGHLEVVKLLLTWGAIDKPTAEENLSLALDQASSYGHIEIVRYLCEYGVVASTLTGALHTAVQCDKLHIVEYLISIGTECNINTMSDVRLLSWACGSGFVDVARLLVSRGADPNTIDHEGNTPFRNALRYPAILKILLTEGGVNPNMHFIDGRTPIIDVVIRCYYMSLKIASESLLLLLQYGADPNLAHADTGDTPLMTAARDYTEIECTDLVELLLEYGADVTHKNRAGKTVLDRLGDGKQYKEVVDLCKKYLDINIPGAKPILK